jgi:excisionase family DNA binding protein
MAAEIYLTVKQAASELGYRDPQSVYDKVRTGEIPSEKIGHFRRIKRSDLEPLIRQRQRLTQKTV